MGRVSKREVEGIRAALFRLDKGVRDSVQQVIERVGTSDLDALKLAIMEELAPVCEEAAELSSRIAQAVYNDWRLAGLGESIEMATVNPYDRAKFEACANTAVAKAAEGAAVEEVANIVTGRAQYWTRQAYGNTMLRAAQSDPARPRFARVPSSTASYSGGCPFCRMLASRGFVYATERTAGKFDHYHANCSCAVVVSFDDSPEVEGYDPEAYYGEYLDARASAKANVEEYREREDVGAKFHTRYDERGNARGMRVEDYANAKYVTANDVAMGYRDNER